MATSKFLVKSSQKGSFATLYLRFRHGKDIDITVKTPLTIRQEYWNNKSQTFKQRIHVSDKDKIEFLEKLSDIKNYLNKAFNNTTDEINKQWLINKLELYFNPLQKKEKKKETLNEYITRFINEIESGERLYYMESTGTSKRYEKGTLKVFKGFQNQFNNYQEDKHVVLNFEDITQDFYNDFNKYFVAEKNYKPNSIGKLIKNLKTIMRAAKDEKLHNSTDFENKSFRTVNVRVENIYLSDAEIDKLYTIKLKDVNRQIACDVFIVGCLSAQRFSDYSRINDSMLKILPNGQMYYDLVQVKTGTRVMIPYDKRIEEILNKYGGRLPKIHEQKLNNLIKEVGEIAGLHEEIAIQEIIGGIKKYKSVPKCQLIQSHTARRSGATTLYNAGLDLEDIQVITGHKSQTELKNYIKSSIQQKAIRILKHERFQNNHLKIAT